MAERRMFTVKITEADEFTSLPPTTQCLYFHLCMSADDDGFSNKIRNSMFAAHADNNDLELLVNKRFVIPFESGVVVIKHWRMHNLIRTDRYHETDYLEEKARLLLKENGAYTDRQPSDNQVTTKWIPNDNQMDTEVSIGKVSIGEDSLVKDRVVKDKKNIYGEYKHVRLTDKERDRLFNDYGEQETLEAIKFLDEYKQRKGYKSKDDNLTLRKWVFDAVKKEKQGTGNASESVFDAWARA